MKPNGTKKRRKSPPGAGGVPEVTSRVHFWWEAAKLIKTMRDGGEPLDADALICSLDDRNAWDEIPSAERSTAESVIRWVVGEWNDYDALEARFGEAVIAANIWKSITLTITFCTNGPEASMLIETHTTYVIDPKAKHLATLGKNRRRALLPSSLSLRHESLNAGLAHENIGSRATLYRRHKK